MTREEMLALRFAAERKKSMAARAAAKPEIAVYPRVDGYEIVVRNPTPELREVLRDLGYQATTGMPNRFGILVKTAAAMDAARDPIKRFF